MNANQMKREIQDLMDEAKADTISLAKRKTKQQLIEEMGDMAAHIISLHAVDKMQSSIIEMLEASQPRPYLWALGGAIMTFFTFFVINL